MSAAAPKLSPEQLAFLNLDGMIHVEAARLGVKREELKDWRPEPNATPIAPAPVKLAAWELPVWKRDDLESLEPAELLARAHDLVRAAGGLVTQRDAAGQALSQARHDLDQMRRERDVAAAATQAGLDAGPLLERTRDRLGAGDWVEGLTADEARELVKQAALDLTRARREIDRVRREAAQVSPAVLAATEGVIKCASLVVAHGFLKKGVPPYADLGAALQTLAEARTGAEAEAP